MLLHQDGSRFAWLPGDVRQRDLIVTLDDATSAIYSAFLVEEEGTASSFRGLREVIERHGLFCALYTDRGSHYFHTPKAGGKVDKSRLTQVGRALAQLGVEHIAAYSPEARGRSERAFRTLQDRLPKELRLAGIGDIEAANHWLAEVYIERDRRDFELAKDRVQRPAIDQILHDVLVDRAGRLCSVAGAECESSPASFAPLANGARGSATMAAVFAGMGVGWPAVIGAGFFWTRLGCEDSIDVAEALDLRCQSYVGEEAGFSPTERTVQHRAADRAV